MTSHVRFAEEGQFAAPAGQRQVPQQYSLRNEIMSLGGVTSLQREGSETFAKIPIAENGICGMITLKNSMVIFTIIDILLGAFYFLFLMEEVIWSWNYFNINGPHYFLTLFYYLRVGTLPIGVIGFIGVVNKNIILAKAYFNLAKTAMILFPIIGALSSFDMCKSYVYYQSCKDIWTYNSAFNVLRFLYLFYVCFIAKSYYRRVERGEIILVTHGKSIVELINAVQSQQKKNDIELVAVKGVAVAEGQVIVAGGQIDDIELPTQKKKQQTETTTLDNSSMELDNQ